MKKFMGSMEIAAGFLTIWNVASAFDNNTMGVMQGSVLLVIGLAVLALGTCVLSGE